MQALLDLLRNLLQLGQGDGAFFTGLEHASKQLIPVKRLTAAILLDHHKRQAFHCLIGGEPLVALQALPAAADTGPLVRGAGIDDLTFQVAAKRTLHLGMTSSAM